jgi:hypothetical protein
MSRFLKSMIVLLAIAAMVTPVMAEDRLSLGGEMRVRGWHIDAGSIDDGEGGSYDYTDSRFDQRLRIGGKLSIAEGVSVTFRFDETESTWGAQPGFGSGRLVTGSNNPMQWDRAHLDFVTNGVAVRAGQQYIALGQSGFDAQDNGFKVSSGMFTGFFMLSDNNGSTVDTADDYYYGAEVTHKTDSYKGSVFAAGQTADGGQNVYMFGAHYAGNLDAVKLVAELDYFTGDASDTTDAFGTQLFVDASMAASEALTVGAQLFYALGDDEDTQFVILGNDFGGWDPLFAVGSNLDNEQIGAGRPFDLFDENAGIIAGRLYASVKASDAATFGASFTYATPEEDANVDADSAMALALGMKYAIMSNTSLGVQVEYIDIDESGVDSILQSGVGLFVNF